MDDEIRQYILNKTPVELYWNNENGQWCWAVKVYNEDFWLNSFDLKDHARLFCDRWELPIVKERKMFE